MPREPVFLQAWSVNRYRCRACGRAFQPMLHTQPALVRLGAVLVGLVAYVGFVATGLGGAVLAAGATSYLVWYRSAAHKRSVARPGHGTAPRYGAVLAECVHCDSADVESLEPGAGSNRFVLKDPNGDLSSAP